MRVLNTVRGWMPVWRKTVRSRPHWYERFGIEPPFPWVGVAIWTVGPLVGGAVVGAGLVLLALIFGGDNLADHIVDF
jgi:hypothetical protein